MNIHSNEKRLKAHDAFKARGDNRIKDGKQQQRSHRYREGKPLS